MSLSEARQAEFDLVQRCIRHEPGAWDCLIATYRPSLGSIVRASLGPLARDANRVEEAVLNIWELLLDHDCKQLATFNPEKGPFTEFLRLTACQALIQEGRRDDCRHRAEREYLRRERPVQYTSGPPLVVMLGELISHLADEENFFLKDRLLRPPGETSVRTYSKKITTRRRGGISWAIAHLFRASPEG
jgi:hypothetical protein